MKSRLFHPPARPRGGQRTLRLRHGLQALAACLLMQQPLIAAAESPTDTCPPTPSSIPSSPAARATLLAALQAHAHACTQNADWYSLRGALLLLDGQTAEAAESLERALLLDPQHPSASADYADALAKLGDVAAARRLAETLLARQDIHPTTRQHLNARLAQWPTEPSPWQTLLELGTQLGWESNLNGGPAADTVQLTLSGGNIVLPLNKNQTPQDGLAGVISGKAQAHRPLGDSWRLLLGGQLRLRDTAGSTNDYALGQFDLSLLRQKPDGELSLQVSRLDQHLGHNALLAENRLATSYQWAAEPCRPRAGLDALERKYPSAGVLDGQQLGLRAGLLCAGHNWLLDTSLRLATDRPLQADRPGGRQRWLELGLTAVRQWGDNAVKAEASFAQVKDAEGYSPLLEANAPRRLARSALRLEFIRLLGPRWQGVAGTEYFAQRSNLSLFQLDNLGLYLGARYRF